MVNTVLQYVFGGAALALGALGYFRPTHRTSQWAGALAAAGAGGAAYYDAFWPMVLLGLTALWCLFLGVNWVTPGWRGRFGLVAGVTLVALLVLLPSMESMSGGVVKCPTYIKERMGFRLVAGLDLRGGLRLVYTVEVAEAIRDKRDAYFEDMETELARAFELHSGEDRPTDEVYNKLREKVTITAPRDESNRIDIEFKNPADEAKFDKRFQDRFRGELDFAHEVGSGKVRYFIREAAESDIRERATLQAKEIILRRVDELGLREASVSTRGEDVIVEVPGEDEASFQQIRDIISQTARLEFKLNDDENKFFEQLSKDLQGTSLPSGISFQSESVSLGQDADEEPIVGVFHFAVITNQDGESSEASLKRFREWTETLNVPPGREIGFEKLTTMDASTRKETDQGWRTYVLKSRAEITGDMIRDAQAQPQSQQGSLGGWLVALTFTERGGSIFERITGDNVKRRFSIILDDKVESSPVIQGRIPGGHATITMGSGDAQVQLQRSRNLEMVLRSGALPAPISLSNEQHIGPSLGRDSIKLALEGALGGSVLVIAFMMLYYRGGGLIANLGVAVNLLLQLAVLASFGASMTLPGIAGLALTVGMSTDSNVLINERIREEQLEGRSPRAAVELGFNRALSAIIDGHITTLIAAVILAQYGTGPIKGFAITLIVGTITSIFSGVVVSRVLFDLWVHGKGRDAKLNVG
ncbi:MAG: protein translocase subunit SecD [Polyangiaceae bacterium]|nr:protein translocase subunit SecD [Polyangiaceae bacterium]MCW5789607.1 protein translocase subunit SecD [Polyangiaceae bacterium]